jgi:hypothetical protein
MTAIDPLQRRWLLVFAVVLTSLIGAALWLYARVPSFRDPPFDFRELRSDEAFNAHGLTRRQDGSLKLGFAEHYPPPKVGAYGNHVIVNFGADAFGWPRDPAAFFNYGYANLALPEIEAYLLHLERLDHLPRRLMLVQITTPNNDNGRYIVDWGSELPPDVVFQALGGEGRGGAWRRAELAWQVLRNELHEVLNYNTVMLSILQGSRDDRVTSEAACQGEVPAWLRRMPFTVSRVVGPSAGRSFYCMPQNAKYGYRRDGSMALPDPRVEPPELVQNRNPLKDAERALNAGDEPKIAHYLRAIDRIGRRHGLAVVFLVPPVYETDRRDSVVNQVFDRALALVPDIAIIDHRGLHGDPALFQDYNHPLPRYYRLVADELRRRGFLDGAHEEVP